MFNNKVLSIDIGTYSVKVISGRFKSNKWNIKDMVELPMNERIDLTNRDDFFDLVFKIKTALTKAGVKYKGKKLVCTVDSALAMTRQIVLPYVTKDLETMIAFEIGNYTTSPIENYEIRYSIKEVFTDEEDNKKMKVYTCAMSKSIIENTYEAFKTMRVEPVGFCVHSSSIQEFYSNADIYMGEKHNTVAFVDIGHSKIGVEILTNGKIDLSRSISYGGKDLDTVFLDMFEMSKVEIEQKKKEVLDADDDVLTLGMDMQDIILIDTSKDILINWISQLQKIIRYYTSKDVGHPIDHIYIYGGSSNIKNLDKFFQNALNIPVSKVDKINNISFGKYSSAVSLSPYINTLGAIIEQKGGKRK